MLNNLLFNTISLVIKSAKISKIFLTVLVGSLLADLAIINVLLIITKLPDENRDRLASYYLNWSSFDLVTLQIL